MSPTFPARVAAPVRLASAALHLSLLAAPGAAASAAPGDVPSPSSAVSSSASATRPGPAEPAVAADQSIRVRCGKPDAETAASAKSPSGAPATGSSATCSPVSLYPGAMPAGGENASGDPASRPLDTAGLLIKKPGLTAPVGAPSSFSVSSTCTDTDAKVLRQEDSGFADCMKRANHQGEGSFTREWSAPDKKAATPSAGGKASFGFKFGE